MSTCSMGAWIVAEKLDSTRVLSFMVTSPSRSAHRLERGSEFLRDDRRLLPRCEVPALFSLVVINEVGIRPLGPAPRGLVLLAGKDADRCRELHAPHAEEAALVYPVDTRGGHARVRQPEQRDVVEEFVTRQFAAGAGRTAHSSQQRRRRLAVMVAVVHQICSQRDR